MPPHIFSVGAAGGGALAEALGAALGGGGKIVPVGDGSCAGGVEGVQATAVGRHARSANKEEARERLMSASYSAFFAASSYQAATPKRLG
jgi:hypothetical protein